MIDTELAFSRPRATALTLAASAADAHRFADKTVLLTGEPETLAMQNGIWCFLDCLRLLPRMVSRIHVHLPDAAGELRSEAERLARAIEFGQPIRFLDGLPAYSEYDAILNVGSRTVSSLPWTAVNSNGWLARVSSKASDLPTDTGQANPMGALAAACLGVSDVFKRLISLRADFADVFDHLEFSLYSGFCDDAAIGPPLPAVIVLPRTLLAGGGAIGNGIALLGTQLKLQGDLWVLDRQQYGSENLGTCALLEPDGVGLDKATYLAQRLRSANGSRLKIHTIVGDIDVVMDQFGTRIPYPELVLAGFDNVPARHRLQDLWPDTIVDGGISEFGVQAFMYQWGSGLHCLKCHFIERTTNNHESLAAAATGLPCAVVRLEALLTEQHVLAAHPERQAWLRERIGKTICSVVSEATMESLAGGSTSPNFSPSVPFVACMSAAMVMGRAVLSLIDPSWRASQTAMFDMLQGPENGITLSEQADQRCDCSRRLSLIESWRQKRSFAETASEERRNAGQ